MRFGSGSGQRAKPEWSTFPVGHGQVFAARKPTLLKRGYSHKAASLGKGAERNSWQAKVAAGLKFQVPEAKRAAEIRYLDRKMGQPVWKGGKNLVKF